MNKHHPNKRQLLADLLAGSRAAKTTLQAKHKPITHLSGMLTTDEPQEPLPGETFTASIRYRDGRQENCSCTYGKFRTLERQAQDTTLIIIHKPQ